MATERQRDDLREWLSQTLPPELAEVIMESLPPFRWDQLATKDDVRDIRADINLVKTDLDLVKADLGTLNADVGTIRTDLGTLNADVGTIRTDLGTLNADVGTIRTDLGTLNADVGTLRTEMSTFSVQLEEAEARSVLRNEAMEHRLAGEMRRLYVDQTRLLFFAMIGAIFTTATLAFAAVRF